MTRPLLSWRQRLGELLSPRHADVVPLMLTQRRIYVLPTRAGLMYAATLALMLVGSINYNLSLGYALTFLLAGLGIVAIVQSFRNLSGLQVAPAPATPGFAGGEVTFGIRLYSARPRAALLLRLADGAAVIGHVSTQVTIQLPLPAQQRGWLKMPRLTIASTWPLGLVLAWSNIRFDEHCLVYPAPAAQGPRWPASSGSGRGLSLSEPDDFFGLRPHRSGDLRQHVAWKASARLDEQLLSKQFATEQGEAVWFDLAQVPGTGLEERLSILARWILDAHAARLSYGLRLGGMEIRPAASTEHLHACLQALALHV